MFTGHFIKTKLHWQNKTKCRICKTNFGIDQTLIRASEDYKLHPHECKQSELLEISQAPDKALAL